MSIVRPADPQNANNMPNANNIPVKETASGAGTVENGFAEAGFWNTGAAAVTIDGQSIPAGGILNYPSIAGRVYPNDIAYDATGSTLLITVIYSNP